MYADLKILWADVRSFLNGVRQHDSSMGRRDLAGRLWHQMKELEPKLGWHVVPPINPELREQMPFTNPVLGYAKELVDEDFCPSGVVEMYWQDDEGWVGNLWCSEHDHWIPRRIRPTHWMEMRGPE